MRMGKRIMLGSCLFWLGFMSCVLAEVPTYKGFPVYPDSSIDTVAREGNDEFTTKEVCTAANKESKNKAAEKYIMDNAVALGWRFIRKQAYECPCHGLVFGKVDTKAHYVEVMFEDGGFEIDDPFQKKTVLDFVKPVENSIKYKFREHGLPILYEGFPLAYNTADSSLFNRINTEEGVVMEASADYNDPSGVRFDYDLPELYGWEKKASSDFVFSEATYTKNGVRVKTSVKNSKISIVFYNQP